MSLIPANFFVVGAARSGTTSLYHYLAQHPQIHMCAAKEANFFVFDGAVEDHRGPGSDWVLRHSLVTREAYVASFAGAGDAKAIGDVSPRYLQRPHCAERIHRERPDARIVAILRHPVDRAFAGFVAHRRDGREPCATLEDAFDDEPRRKAAGWTIGCNFEVGLYAQQLEPYFERFHRDHVRIYLYDDLVADAGSLMADLFAFLKVDSAFEPDMSKRHNPSGTIRNPLLREFWRRSDALRQNVRPLLPKQVRDAAYRQVQRSATKPVLSSQVHAALTERYRDEILELQDLISRDLTHWLPR